MNSLCFSELSEKTNGRKSVESWKSWWKSATLVTKLNLQPNSKFPLSQQTAQGKKTQNIQVITASLFSSPTFPQIPFHLLDELLVIHRSVFIRPLQTEAWGETRETELLINHRRQGMFTRTTTQRLLCVRQRERTGIKMDEPAGGLNTGPTGGPANRPTVRRTQM